MARLVQRPVESLVGWRQRYGDIYTVPLPIFGVGCYVSGPEAIREMLTGDQSDLLAGEANDPLSPVVGKKSLLTLDGREHLRQRKLLLPPFQGSAVHSFREVIREVAEAEVAAAASAAASAPRSPRPRWRRLSARSSRAWTLNRPAPIPNPW
jgi:cytochrome P450